jgi:hypothetical protein
MGTSATTLIKKNNKVFPLGTSYDGYFSYGLGYSNLLGIHSFSNETLNKLVDDFNQYIKVDYAKSKDFFYYNSEHEKQERLNKDNYKEYSDEEIDNSLKIINKTILHKQSFEHFKKAYNNKLSMQSSAGFAGILFLGRNNHFARDYCYSDYLIDLDENKIVIGKNISIKFDSIRSLNKEQLNFLCGMVDFNNLPEKFKNEFPTEFKKFIRIQDFVYDENNCEYKKKSEKSLVLFEKYLNYISTVDSNMLIENINILTVEKKKFKK